MFSLFFFFVFDLLACDKIKSDGCKIEGNIATTYYNISISFVRRVRREPPCAVPGVRISSHVPPFSNRVHCFSILRQVSSIFMRTHIINTFVCEREGVMTSYNIRRP